jgi:thiol:disulfide interchange protein
MKKTSLLFIAFALSFCSFCQDSLVWQSSSKKINDSTYEIVAKTTVQKGWHLYGINQNIEGLENFTINYSLEKIKSINGLNFITKPQTITDSLFENKSISVFFDNIEIKDKIIVTGFVPATIKITCKGFVGKGLELLPIKEIDNEVALEGGKSIENKSLILSNVDIKNPQTQCGDKVETGNLVSIFFLGLLGGLIALFTPCMFPMIPVTVSFFTKRSPTRKKGIQNGLLYGFFIFLIYALASTPFHLLNLSGDIFNSISTNPIVNIIFFIVFIIFAISFFGYFEISLPHSIAGKADSKSNLGSTFGIFFMALTLVIVSFSCTGIILGTLLVGTSSGGAWALTIGMSGFGIALGFPFALFAIFPNWLESLPKSGGWLDVVKKVLAFVEVALALKFLSNADLVKHWGILYREIFIALWIIISIGLALYAFGILRLPHDYKGQKITTIRKIIGVVAIAFALYLIPGLTKTQYANLKLLSGIAPPLSYSIYKDENRFKGLEPNVINDYEKALALAKQQHKPLLIDFTGWNCTNCRQMEENVWTEPEVYKTIKDHFILVSLYVDDGAKLPVEKRMMNYKTKSGNVKDIITIGDKYSIFEYDNFNKSAQPLYIMLNNDEKLLAFPVGKCDAKKYADWLQCGLSAFNK